MLRMKAMNEAIQKFKEMVAKVNSIVVATDTNPDTNKVFSATVLHAAFIGLGKNSLLEIGPIDEKSRRFLDALCGKIVNGTQKEHLVIKLDSKSMPVSELQYEKVGDSFNIILESIGALNPNNIKIERVRAPADLLVLIDPKESEMDSLCAKIPHKDVIKLSSKERSVAIKVSEIVFAFFDTIPDNITTPLLYLITQGEKEAGRYAPKILEIKQLLLKAGADQQLIGVARGEFLGGSFWKLLGRALARSEFEKKLRTVWSFLPFADFQKTGQNTSMIKQIFEELRSVRQEADFIALLWEESPKNISAIVGGKDIERLSIIAKEIGSVLASTYFLLHNFETFSHAELKIRSHIQRAL